VFNQDISYWDTSSVTNMSSMFESSKAFNQDINRWDISSVTDMSKMFYQAESFEKSNVESWDLSGVNTTEMFGR
ncbi:BspA family leucine-rich repeat surface protein, partial [Moritella viscosa]|uniref:BspA family leucine-rich repeat surface protein n=1 Tax=Moritella viscosa TaxID=80854 RepID=UPI003B42BDD5